MGVMDSSGNLVNGYVYDPFGNLFEQNETVANPWQYASGYLDSTTGLYHFGARYYNPALGRWTQQDPAAPNLASPDSLNRYLYVGDSPVNGTDRSGETTWWDIFTQCISLPVTGIIALVGAVLGALSVVVAGILAVTGVATAPLWVTWLGIIGAILFLGVTAFCTGFATVWVLKYG